MDGHRFDRLTRSWADGKSRRTLLGSALGGVMAAALGRSAAANGNSDCAHFCNAVYPPGSARGKCKSDAAKNVPGNLCAACGADSDRVCTTPSGAKICCAGDETCVAGSCQGACDGEICGDGGCCDTSLSLGCCPSDGDEQTTCTALSGDPNCGACGVTCLGQTVEIAPDFNVSLGCCDGGCALLVGQACALESPLASCCGGDANCYEAPGSISPTGRVCCMGAGHQCSDDVQPCCAGLVCGEDDLGNPTCVPDGGGA